MIHWYNSLENIEENMKVFTDLLPYIYWEFRATWFYTHLNTLGNSSVKREIAIQEHIQNVISQFIVNNKGDYEMKAEWYLNEHKRTPDFYIGDKDTNNGCYLEIKYMNDYNEVSNQTEKLLEQIELEWKVWKPVIGLVFSIFRSDHRNIHDAKKEIMEQRDEYRSLMREKIAFLEDDDNKEKYKLFTDANFDLHFSRSVDSTIGLQIDMIINRNIVNFIDSNGIVVEWGKTIVEMFSRMLWTHGYMYNGKFVTSADDQTFAQAIEKLFAEDLYHTYQDSLNFNTLNEVDPNRLHKIYNSVYTRIIWK